MAKRKRKPVALKATERDFVMARLAAGRAAAQAAINAIDEAMMLYVDVDEDEDGEERAELVAEALENVGISCRALESAEAMVEGVDPLEREPWDEADETDDDDGEED